MHFFKWLTRIVVSTTLFAAALFCLFGFLATYEPPEAKTLRVMYAVLGVACVAGGVLSTVWRWSFDESKGPNDGRVSG